MYRLFLSLRFLRHHWLMTLIGSFFVGASLIILVVVMSVMDGFQSKLKETIAGASADMTLSPNWPCDPVALAKAVEELVPGVEAAAPYYETFTLTRRAGNIDPMIEKMHPAAVFGVDPRREARINRFAEYLSILDHSTGVRLPTVRDKSDPFKVWNEKEEALGTVGVVLGRGLAEDVGVFPNEKIRITIATSKAGGKGDIDDYSFKYVQVLVVGIYQSGNSEVDKSCIFMDHKAFRGYFGDETSRASVRCKLADPEHFDATSVIPKVMERLAEKSNTSGADLSGKDKRMKPESWRDKNKTLVQAIESEKSMILVIAFLIVVAGTSSIFAAQWLLVSDKIREIGILRALGADFNGVVSIFVLNGFLMGALGAIGGAGGGLLVVHYIDAVHAMISWVIGRPVFDKDIYLFDRIPTLVDYGEVARYAGAALVCTLIASAIPAMRAGLMKPAEALHRD